MYLEKKMTLRVNSLSDSEKIVFRKGEGGHVFISINGVEETVGVESFRDILDSLYELIGDQ